MANSSLWDALNIPLDSTGDPKVLKETIRSLFNLIEDQATTIRQQSEQIQRLRDEVNRLKGEQGKPDVKPPNRNQNQDISSEEERKRNQKPKGNKGSKNDKIKIDRTEICDVDKTKLHKDAVFKGYETVIVQDLKIETDHVAFQQAVPYPTCSSKIRTSSTKRKGTSLTQVWKPPLINRWMTLQLV